ncbi:restriction endonuclease [Flavobacteriaceae bacterium]|nr:restriction endonuclease [Flavobacteriaceae bacterium]
MKNNIPDFQAIMLPMLRLLKDGKQKTLIEVMKHLASFYNLTEEELKIRVPSGQMGLFRNRIGWTRSHLKKAGLIKYPERGIYQITEKGTDYLNSNPVNLGLKQLKKMPLYIEWIQTFNQDSKNNIESKTNIEAQTPEEILANTVTQLNVELASELLDKLKENSFGYFENFVIKLLQKMGYGAFREDAGKVTGQIGDDGIDGIIYQDRLGLETVYIQAKRYSNGTVGSPEIRNFIGSLAIKGVSKGVFLTTSRFSESATRTAKDSKQQKIVLLNGKSLANLAIEFNLGVQIENIINIKKIDLDFFEE